jgi:hypothetical protein
MSPVAAIRIAHSPPASPPPGLDSERMAMLRSVPG